LYEKKIHTPIENLKRKKEEAKITPGKKKLKT
jgi:hypothetical protein